MAITVSGTTITFNDATTQTTAAGAAPTAGNGITVTSGTIALGVPTGSSVGTYTAGAINVNNTAYGIGSSQAGSALCYLEYYIGSNTTRSSFNNANSPGFVSLGLSGTWRACAMSKSLINCCGTYGQGNLWIRTA
jgi:hypothetical protein